MVFLFVKHKWSNGLAGIGAVTGLTLDVNGGTTNTKLVLGTRNSTRGRRHCGIMLMERELTGVVDGGTTSQWCSLYPLLVRTITGSRRTDHLTQLRVQLHSHHCDPPLLLLTDQWRNEHAPPFVILTHMMSLIHQLFSIYNSWFVICVVTVHGLCTTPALY